MAFRFPLLLILGLAVLGSARPTARTFFEQGQKAFDRGDYRTALERYNHAIEKNGSFFKAHLALGETYSRLGEPARARHAFNAALTIEPKHLGAMLGSARASLSLGEKPAAIATLEAARKLDPGSDRIALLDAELAMAEGHPGIAQRHYRRILRSNPGHGPALRGAALAASRQGDFEEAAALIRRAQLVEPVNPEVHRIQGLVRLREALELPTGTARDSALEAAHESLRTALQLRPGDSGLEFRLLWLELHQGNMEAARDRARRLVSSSGTSGEQQYLPAYVLLSGSAADAMQARELLLRLLKSAPDDSIVRFRLEQMVLGNRREHSPQSALRARLARYHRARFSHYDERQMADRRDFHLERTLELGTSDALLLRRKLELARLRGDFPVFVDLLQQLVIDEPGNVSLRYRLENALRRRVGDLEHAAIQEIGPVGREAAGVFVFDLKSESGMPHHPDGGQMMARALERHLRDQGRVKPVPTDIQSRAREEAGLSAHDRETGEGLIFKPARLTRLAGAAGMGGNVAFYVGGSYQSDANGIRATYDVFDATNGRRMVRFRLDGRGRDAIHELSSRAARRIAGLAAARATVKGFLGGGLLLNAGVRDGLSAGARFLVYRADLQTPAPIEREMQEKLLRQVRPPLYCTVKRVTQRVALCVAEGELDGRFHRGDRAVLLAPAQTARSQ